MRLSVVVVAFILALAGGVAAAPGAQAAAVETPVTSMWLNTSSAAYGSVVKVTSEVQHPWGSRIAYLPVRLQEWTSGGWRTLVSTSLGPYGWGVFYVRPDMSRAYRVYFPGWYTAGHWVYYPSVSGVRGVTLYGAAAGTRAQRAVSVAAAQRGKPYAFGAAGPYAFDCSGLTQYVYRAVGWGVLPHNANSQKYYGSAVAQSAKIPGDLLVFTSGGYGYHVAVYAGNGYMWDAPGSGQTVGLHRIWSNSYLVRRLV